MRFTCWGYRTYANYAKYYKKFNVQDPYDIYENIDAGTKHLKGMIERYSGDIVRAVAPIIVVEML